MDDLEPILGNLDFAEYVLEKWLLLDSCQALPSQVGN